MLPFRSSRQAALYIELRKKNAELLLTDSGGSGELAETNVSDVFNADFSVGLAPLKNFGEFLHHGRVAGMGFHRGVGCGEQASAQALEIKHLRIVELRGLTLTRREESLQRAGLRVCGGDFFIVGSVANQKLFVFLQERRAFFLTLIPNNHHPAGCLEDARELGPRAFRIEPVKCLAGSDEVHGMVIERNRFSGSIHAAKSRTASQQALRRLTHFLIRLNPVDEVAVLEEQLREDARPGADIGNDGLRRKSALLFQQCQDAGWISGPVFAVVFGPVGEPRDGVFEHAAPRAKRLSPQNLEARGAGRRGTDFGSAGDAEAQALKEGLAEGHKAGVEVAPDKEQQERNGGVIFVADGVENRGREIKAQGDLDIGDPAGAVAIALLDEGVRLRL